MAGPRWREPKGDWQPSECPGPWMSLYVEDFDGGTSGMQPDALGVYVRLLLHEWQHGPLPDTMPAIASITRAHPRTLAKVWPLVAMKFIAVELMDPHPFTSSYTGLVCVWLERERSRRLKTLLAHGIIRAGRGVKRKMSLVARLAVIERDHGVCRYCGWPASVVDHIIPICQGGTNSPLNLAAACTACNRKKAGRTPLQAGMVLGGR